MAVYGFARLVDDVGDEGSGTMGLPPAFLPHGRPADILVSVSNSGDGIPADEIAHVFERFYRVDKSRDRVHGGAGIGLSIVQQLVEAAGGRVGAESSEGTTRFWFALPA